MTAQQKPGGLLEQWNLLGEVMRAPWASRLDMKVSRALIDQHYAKFGNARASYRFLEQATDSARNKIVPCVRKLAKHGVITVARKGKGTRPTEYVINFDFKAEPCSIPQEGTSTSVPQEGTSSGAVAGDVAALVYPWRAPKHTYRACLQACLRKV
jgi:hypothetical protein